MFHCIVFKGQRSCGTRQRPTTVQDRVRQAAALPLVNVIDRFMLIHCMLDKGTFSALMAINTYHPIRPILIELWQKVSLFQGVIDIVC